MANEEHLKILKQGVAAWNQWRVENQDLVPNLANSNLRGAYLAAANLNSVNLSEAFLMVSDLSGATLMDTNLSGANLARANLRGANLEYSNLCEVDLRGADLRDANLFCANLIQAYITEANLRETSLLGTNLSLATLTGTDLTGAEVDSTTFSQIDLNAVNGLGSVDHRSPSSIGVDTLTLTLRGSGGRFTKEQLVFFENAGVPATLLEYLPSILESNPLQFHACFISYSTRDEDFAEQLNQDLNKAGIKTWKWDRDAVRGRDLAQNIDLAIRTHDKTILVCSVNSLTSPQVEREIQEALDKEVQIKTANAERRKEALAKGEKPPTVDADVLIPIRLDDTIFGWDSHLKSEVTRRMVADFTSAPPGSDKYQQELQLLIKALNPKSWPPVASR